jgi:hypothetical protein
MLESHHHPASKCCRKIGWFAALFLVTVLTATAPAGDGQPPIAASPSIFASRYWDGFVDFWTDALRKQNGVVMVVLGAGALSLFIITRGKKLK